MIHPRSEQHPFNQTAGFNTSMSALGCSCIKHTSRIYIYFTVTCPNCPKILSFVTWPVTATLQKVSGVFTSKYLQRVQFLRHLFPSHLLPLQYNGCKMSLSHSALLIMIFMDHPEFLGKLKYEHHKQKFTNLKFIQVHSRHFSIHTHKKQWNAVRTKMYV